MKGEPLGFGGAEGQRDGGGGGAPGTATAGWAGDQCSTPRHTPLPPYCPPRSTPPDLPPPDPPRPSSPAPQRVPLSLVPSPPFPHTAQAGAHDRVFIAAGQGWGGRAGPTNSAGEGRGSASPPRDTPRLGSGGPRPSRGGARTGAGAGATPWRSPRSPGETRRDREDSGAGGGGAGHHAESSAYLWGRAGEKRGERPPAPPGTTDHPQDPQHPHPRAQPIPGARGDRDAHRDVSLVAPWSSPDAAAPTPARLPYLRDTEHGAAHGTAHARACKGMHTSVQTGAAGASSSAQVCKRGGTSVQTGTSPHARGFARAPRVPALTSAASPG